MSIEEAGEVFTLQGALSFETVPGVLAESDKYGAREDLPDRFIVDFSQVTGVDSSGVALLLEWRRRAQRANKTLTFVNLPPNLLALARLYGVAELLQPQAAA